MPGVKTQRSATKGNFAMEIGDRRRVSMGAASLLAVSLVSMGAQPAVALPDEEPMVQSESVPLTITGWDAGVAQQNGYEARSDSEGNEFIVPMSNAPGDFTGATAFPQGVSSDGVEAATDDVVQPFGTVTGNCGTSSIFINWSGLDYWTGYTLNLGLGGAFSHVWRVSISMNSGSRVANLDGLATFSSLSWVSGDKSIGLPGQDIFVWVSSGKATTTLGFECISLGPSDRL